MIHFVQQFTLCSFVLSSPSIYIYIFPSRQIFTDYHYRKAAAIFISSLTGTNTFLLLLLLLTPHQTFRGGGGLTHSPWEIRINFQVGQAESKNDSFCLPLKLRPRHLLIFIEADPAQSPPPPFLSGSPAPFAALNNARRFNASYVKAGHDVRLKARRPSPAACAVLSPPRCQLLVGENLKVPNTRCQNRLSSVENDPKD